MKSTSTRCALLDELRGLDLISMMLYHGMWDLVYLFGVSAPWYGSWQGELWQQSICWVFILLSGFCLPLGHHPVKRGAMVFGCGALVTAVTLIFMPADVVWFGVLTLLGSAMIITGLLEKWLEKVPPVVEQSSHKTVFAKVPEMGKIWRDFGHAFSFASSSSRGMYPSPSYLIWMCCTRFPLDLSGAST